MNPRTLQTMVFVLFALGILGGIHYYLWARLVRDPGWPAPVTRAATVAVVALGVLLLATMIFGRMLPRAAASVLAWAAFVWLGVAFLLFAGLVSTELFRVVSRLVWSNPDDTRRLFFARGVAALVGGGAAIAAMVAVRQALSALTVRTVRVPIAGLHPSLEGMTVVQLTDIHVGPTIGRPFIEEMVRRVNELRPDVIAITGDLVDGPVSELGHHVAPLADLKARHGVYFVTGNHEYYSGVDAWLAELTRLGVRVLRNERVTLGEGDAVLDVAGVDDWSARRFGNGHGADLTRALAGRDASRPVVLLAHQPKAITEAAEKGVHLVLSGHTHGGQIWPWTKLVALDQPILAGLHRVRETHIYVSEGTGYWGPPMRLGTRAEISKLVLVRA